MSDDYCPTILPDPDSFLRKQGWRLAVELDVPHDYTGLVQISRQRVYPEHVANPRANAILEEKTFGWCTLEEIRWLRDQLSAILAKSPLPSVESEAVSVRRDLLEELRMRSREIRLPAMIGPVEALLSAAYRLLGDESNE